MKKIAIITFSRANNYGALLQAYALKSALQKFSAQADIINYLSYAMEVWHNPHPLLNRNLKHFIRKIILFPYKFYVHSRFSPFMDTYLDGKQTYSKNTLYKLESTYDAFITGSDQVFNFTLTDNDTTYLLDFIKDTNKKYSYAASFGRNDLPDSEKALAALWLKQFKTISVREASAVPLAKELSGKKDVRADIDPTLLLSKEDWRKTAVMPKENDYILLYLMSDNSSIREFAYSLAEKTGLKLIMLSIYPSFHKGIKTLCPTPQEWLGYFLNAKYIVTNSFHGLAFSINFNKDFFVDLLPPPSKVNSRLENLLDLTGLRGRLISAGANLDTPAPDWAEVNAKLAAEKEKSLSYLRSMAE